MNNNGEVKARAWRNTENALEFLRDLLIFVCLSTWYMLESFLLTIMPNFMRPLKSLRGQVVLITGGGGGLGQILAQKMARLHCTVVVWDINKEGLMKTCELIEAEGFKAHMYVCDVSDRVDVYSTAKRVKIEVGDVDVLVNNAGTVCGNTLLDLPDASIEKTYKVNILAHYWTVKAFLPDMLTNRRGHIVTLGSVAGMLGCYRCTDYSATKAAAIAFHESLFSELRAQGNDFIYLTLVCPYFINTGMFEGCTPYLKPMLQPDYVASSIIMSIRKNEVNCVLPDSIRIFLPLKCLLPAKVCWELMHRVIKGPQAMMNFRGRTKVAAG